VSLPDRRKRQRWPYLLTDHVFDKVRSLDMTLAEFEQLLGSGEIIEETELQALEVKEVVLVIEWKRPVHVVVIVDDARHEERIVTVYEPDPDQWSPDLKRRRR
jgi:hypothetical protein